MISIRVLARSGTAVVAATLGAALWGSSPAAAVTPEVNITENLICEGDMAVTLALPVTTTPSFNVFSATAELTSCYSPSDANADIASGHVAISGSGTLDCELQHTYAGTAEFVWKDASGEVLGGTTVPFTGNVDGDPDDDHMPNQQFGTASTDSGELALQQMLSMIVPVGATGTCETGGVTGLTGPYQVTFGTGLNAARNLECEGEMTITLDQPVTYAEQLNGFTADGELPSCFSPSGFNSNVASATVKMTGSGVLSCDLKQEYSGSAELVWHDAFGAELGRTAVEFTGNVKGDPDDDAMPNVQHGIAGLDSSLFQLQQMTSAFVPTGAIGQCEDTGVSQLTGLFQLSFRSV